MKNKKSQHKASPNNSHNHSTTTRILGELPKELRQVSETDRRWMEKHGRYLLFRALTPAEQRVLPGVNRGIVCRREGLILAFEEETECRAHTMTKPPSPFVYSGDSRRMHAVVDIALAFIFEKATDEHEILNPAIALLMAADLVMSVGGGHV